MYQSPPPLVNGNNNQKLLESDFKEGSYFLRHLVTVPSLAIAWNTTTTSTNNSVYF